MTDTIIDVTTGAVMIPEVWSSKMLVARENYLVAAKCVDRYDEDVAQYGDTIHVPEVSNLVATQVSAGTDVTYQAPTESEMTILINQHWETSFLIHDRFSAQSKYRYADKMAEKSGYALGSKIDNAILSLYSSASKNVGDGSTKITEANILVAIRDLDVANVPAENRHFIIDAYGKAQMNSIDNFVRYDATGQVSPAMTAGNQRTGNDYGNIWNLTVHISNDVVTVAGTPVVIHGLLFQQEAIGLAVQKNVATETTRMAWKLADLWVSQVLFGVSALRTDHMVDFRYQQA